MPIVAVLIPCLLALGLACLAPPASAAQQAGERPDVHSEFAFGSFPYSPEAAALFESEVARMLVGALDRGWSLDKFLKETGGSQLDALTLLDDLEQANLVRGTSEYDRRPGLLLVRESEAQALRPDLEADAAEFVRIIGEHWEDVERFVASLDAGQDLPRGQLFYTAIVGGVLTGGLVEALADDQTLIPGPPRRNRETGNYYAWLVESSGRAPLVGKQSDRVGAYTVYSVGTEREDNVRIQIEELRTEGPVFESEDAGRWRVFSSVFSRDYLLPYLKSRRSGLLDLHRRVRSSRYAAFAEFAAWYYQELATLVVDGLVERNDIAAPESSYKYAIRTAR
jgi:hypothetical protein